MSDDTFKRRADAVSAVTEIEQRKLSYLQTIGEKETELSNRRSFDQRTDEERARVFFLTGATEQADLTSLEAELRELHEKLHLCDVEIARRQNLVSALDGPYQAAVFKPLKPADDKNKEEMAAHLIGLAKCFADEIALIDQLQRADTTPPASFRAMRPNFIGRLNDPNSFVGGWLRELAIYYPHLKIKV